MFPNYYVLDELTKLNKPFRGVNNYCILSVQHLLESTGSLFLKLINTGIRPQNIFLTGKIYSTNKSTLQRLQRLGINITNSSIPNKLGHYSKFLEKDIVCLWQELVKILQPSTKIIILDDGGYALKNVPHFISGNFSVFGIEQTTSGIRMKNAFAKFPVIDVASSAAKRIIEPPIVSEAVKIQLGKTIRNLNPRTIGIVGYGNIGKAITKDLAEVYKVAVYDINDRLITKGLINVTAMRSLNELFEYSDVIIGATGRDISNPNWLINPNGNKTLISVSSGDIEFNKILRSCEKYLTEKTTNPLQTLNLRTENGYSLKILRGGMVANFTGSRNSSPGNVIQITRGLLLSAIFQIIRDHKRLTNFQGRIMLSPTLQSQTVRLWFQNQPQKLKQYSNDIVLGFKDREWIKSRSSGLCME